MVPTWMNSLLDSKSDNKHQENGDWSNQTEFTDVLRNLFQFVLKRSGCLLILLNQGSNFSKARVISNHDNDHLSFSCQHSSSGEHDRGRYVMESSWVLLSSSDYFVHFFDAVINSILFYWFSLSSHGALIGRNLISLYQYSISWNFHALGELNHVTNQDLILVNLHELSVSLDAYSFSGFCYLI
jgi:hypothetical protein